MPPARIASVRPALLPRRTALRGGLALTSLVLAGCSTGTDAEPSPSAGAELLRAHGLDGLEAREIIDRLEALSLDQRPTDLLAAVMPDRLDLTDTAERQVSLPLPEGQSYVSVAPFVQATHDCFYHSLTTCLGELQEQDLEVRVHRADGEVLVDEVRTTAPNGFLGLWLPRDQELTLTIDLDGATATAPLATDADAPTCVTTMQLGA